MNKEKKSDRKPVKGLEMDAVSYDKIKRLDSTFYEKKYPDMQFMWINDLDGDVQRWLQLGAEPQCHEKSKFAKEFPGLTDKNQGSYVSVVAGTDNGTPFNAYLLKMPKDRYDEVKINPTKQRNHDIQTAMGLKGKTGQADSEDRDGSNLDTYAPNLPTGGQGFEKIAGKAGFNQLTQ